MDFAERDRDEEIEKLKLVVRTKYLRSQVRIMKAEKALYDTLSDLDGIINEAEEGYFSLEDLRDLRADLHGAISMVSKGRTPVPPPIMSGE